VLRSSTGLRSDLATPVNESEIPALIELHARYRYMTISRTDSEIQFGNFRAAIKVLYIEDDPSLAESMARALRLAGMEVASAATREEAIEHVEVHGLRPDVILTDFHLGKGLTSETVVAELAVRLHFKPPTILLTGSGVLGTRRFADRVLSKPVHIVALLRAIDDLHAQAITPTAARS